MNWIKKSITRKIGLSILLVVFVLFSIYYFFINVQFKNYYEQQSKELLMNDSEYISSGIEIFLQKFIMIVEQGKMNPDFLEFAGEVNDINTMKDNRLFGRIKSQLIDISGLDKNIALSYIAVSEANDLITSDYDGVAIPDYDLNNREWYTSILEEGDTTVTAPYLDLVTGQITVTIAAPLTDQEKVLGVFALDIMIEDLRKMMLDHKIGKSGYAVLAYNDGRILYHPDYNIKDVVYVKDIVGDKSEELLSGKSGITNCVYKGKEKFAAHLPIKNTNLIVFTIISKEEVYSQLNSFLLTNLLILVGILALSYIMIAALRNLISAPVINISREIESYSKNKKEICLPGEYLDREDELGVLSRGLALMVQEISNYVVETEYKNQELIRVKEKISMERSLFKTTIHSLADGVIATDEFGIIRIMNNVAEDLTEWPVEQAYGKGIAEVFRIKINGIKLSDLYDEVYMLGHVFRAEDILLTKRTGEELLIEGNVAPIKDEEGNISGAVIVFRDFTEKKQKQEQILYLSYHDQLTGLYNRRFFEEELERLDTEENLPLSIAMVDVNGLKLTNDAFGHMTGDKLLIRVAKILSTECRKTDVVARIGGDEFVIILPKTTDTETGKIVSRIYKAIAREKMDNIIISISIGYDTKIRSDERIENVMNKAEEQMYMKKLTESKSMRNKTIQAILNTLREKNQRERVHCERVSRICKEIARQMNMDEETAKEIEYAGLMHDIGKIAVSDDILNKPGRLTDAEYQEMKRHTESGYQILRSVDAYTSLAEIALSHHERWDGKGYPRGLAGEEIPLIARIITVADAYEAMTENRPYKKAMTKDAAIEELIKNSGTQFDPEIVRVLIEKVFGFPGKDL